MANSDNLIVRPSASEDIPKITEIYGKSVLEGLGSFEIDPPDELEMTARRNNILEQQLPYLVAEKGETILGYAYASLYRPRPAYRNSIENSVYVSQEAQGQGVGTALLQQLIEKCRLLDKKQMIAVIGDSGNRSSIALHRAHGFRLVGILEAVGYKHDRWVDTVIMQKNLSEGADG
jgi:L-amino acid N-acyltransferase YncA